MELRHLRYFLATAEAGSVSAAADVVHVTQPALSRQLRQLEGDLGVDLFDRSAGRLRLNRTGLALLPAVRAVLEEVEALKVSAAFHARGRVDRLTIAGPTVTLTDVVSPFVATMGEDEPVVDVRPADGASTAEMLHAGADLAIGTSRPAAPFVSVPLATLPLWAYVRSDDGWADRGTVRLAELVERPLVGLPATYSAREVLDAALATAGLRGSTMVEAANGTIAQALAASGRGVAVVSDDPRYGLVPLAIEVAGRPLVVRLCAGWDSRSAAAPVMEALAGRLREWILDNYGDEAETARPIPARATHRVAAR